LKTNQEDADSLKKNKSQTSSKRYRTLAVVKKYYIM